VFSLGAVVLPLYVWVLASSPDMLPLERAFHLWGIGSLRASWAVYCSHAISHGRWPGLAGAYGSPKFNAALAFANVGTLFGVYPSYWLFHQRHHTHLGAYTLLEARELAKQGRATDGDLGLAQLVLHSAPSRKYSVALRRSTRSTSVKVDGEGEAGGVGVEYEPRLPEGIFLAQAVLLHGFAPVLFFLSALTRSSRSLEASDIDAGPPSPAAPAATTPTASAAAPPPSQQPRSRLIDRSIAIQSSSQLLVWLLVLGLSMLRESAWPLAMCLASQLLWLSPLNPNWLWTCPHLCEKGSGQPTVSFYTPDGPLGAALDAYMGWENFHVEHHDFPDMPMYNLPRLRSIAPEHYGALRSMPVLDQRTWADAWQGTYFYACQDLTFGGDGVEGENNQRQREKTGAGAGRGARADGLRGT
jgi:fatty acid desaturase